MSPTGNDANSGTSASPYRTMAGLLAAHPTLGATDTIILKDGTYTEAMILKAGGSTLGQLIVQAENRGQALIRPTSGYSAFVIWRDYVTIDGLDVTMGSATKGTGTGHGAWY